MTGRVRGVFFYGFGYGFASLGALLSALPVAAVFADARTVFGFTGDYRKLSEKAIVVHEPREVCEKRGFDPRF